MNLRISTPSRPPSSPGGNVSPAGAALDGSSPYDKLRERFLEEPELTAHRALHYSNALQGQFHPRTCGAYRYIRAAGDRVVHCCKIGDELKAVTLWASSKFSGGTSRALATAHTYQEITNKMVALLQSNPVVGLAHDKEVSVRVQPIERIIATRRNGLVKNVFSVSPYPWDERALRPEGVSLRELVPHSEELEQLHKDAYRVMGFPEYFADANNAVYIATGPRSADIVITELAEDREIFVMQWQYRTAAATEA